MSNPQERRSGALFLACAGALSILVGVAVALPDYLPTNDGPEHVFGSYALRHLDDSAPGYGRYLQPGAAFSQLGFDQLFGFWQRLLGWRNGLRASLVVMCLAWAWGVVALAAATCKGKRRWLGLAGFAVAIQWQLYMGFFAFYLATGFGFYLVALVIWRTRWNATARAVLAAGLAGQALMHPFAAICTGATLFIITLWHEGPTRRRQIGWLLLLAAPAALIALASSGKVGEVAPTVFLPLRDRATLAVTAFVSGPAWRRGALPLCAVLAAASALASRAWRADRTSGAMLTAGLLFAVLATQAPHHVVGWQFFSMRFAPFACVFWLMLLPVETWPRWGRAAGLAVLVVFSVSSNVWALHYNLKLRAASDDILSGLAAPIRRDGPRLPLIIEPRAGEPQDKPSRTIPYATANWNVGSLYAVEQGGVPAWTFAESATLHPVVWRWPVQQGLRPPRPERGFEWELSEPDVLGVPGARKARVTHLLSYAPFYQDVIFYGLPEEVAWLQEKGFAIDFQRGGLAIARFQACPAKVEFWPGPTGHSATVVQFGWAPATEPTYTTTLPASPARDAPRSWTIDECPCSDIWLRVLFDRDGDGKLSPGDSTCVEASALGVLSARVRPGRDRIECHPGRSFD